MINKNSMIVTLKLPVNYDVKELHVNAKVRYWEDSSVNGEDDTDSGALMPCVNGDYWEPIIDIDSGKILNWIPGKTAEIHYKVCDGFMCSVVDKDGIHLINYDGYVPSIMCPKDSGYGDYIIMDINEDGIIQDWKFEIDDLLKEE